MLNGGPSIVTFYDSMIDFCVNAMCATLQISLSF